MKYIPHLIQGTQFFHRFNAREFATLIIDVLSEAKRRQAGIPSPLTTPKDKGNQCSTVYGVLIVSLIHCQ